MQKDLLADKEELERLPHPSATQQPTHDRSLVKPPAGGWPGLPQSENKEKAMAANGPGSEYWLP